VTTLRSRDRYLRKLTEKERLGAYSCDHCGETFADRDDYEDHVNGHHETQWESGTDAEPGSAEMPVD
jgi:uncharacterized C2H2 Zn-finger protein